MLVNKFTVAPLHASLAVGAVNVGVPVHSIVASAPAAPIVGACVSVMDRNSVVEGMRLVLGATRFIKYKITLAHALPVVVLVNKFTVAPLHASLAVGAVNVGVPVHSIVASADVAPCVGSCVSVMVMTCVLVAL